MANISSITLPDNSSYDIKAKKIFYADCSTARNVAAKVVTCSEFVLEAGAVIVVRFTNTGTSNPASGNISLNINSTGAKNIVAKDNNTVYTYSSGSYFYNNQTMIFVYNGTYFIHLNRDNNTDTKVTAVGNHYTPAKSTTKSASGGTLTDIANSSAGAQVVTGVEMDAKGHVTGVTSAALKTTVPVVVSLTRAEYDAISIKNPDTYYMITDDAGFHTSSPRILTVGVDKQYTSFTAAMRAAETIKNRKVVINIDSGEYDVYNELGGDNFIKGIGDALWTDGFQPIMDNDVEIHGIGDVTLKLEVPDDIFNSYRTQAQLVSVVNNTIGNILVDNITFKCKNNRYAIHDECGNDVAAIGTKHIFKNCRFYNNNTLCCIGIGTTTGHFEIENCYIENTGRCFFLHDWRLSTGGTLLILNSVFSSTNNEYDILLGVNSTNTFNVYLSNNYLKKIHIKSIDINNYNTNIFRITGVHNTVTSATLDSELSNPYPINLLN